MSTDTTESSLLTPPHAGYDVIEHRNSNRSRRNGTAAASFRKGLRHISYQVIRRSGGLPLPHLPTLLKRNKYAPHVGKKQLAKLSH